MSGNNPMAPASRSFDTNSNVVDFYDTERPSITEGMLAAKRVGVDMPLWMVRRLDMEAAHLGVLRQDLIKMWIGERLEVEHERRVGPA